MSFPNTMLSQTLPAYVYQQYSDDDDLQAFNAAYNDLVQEYVTWFNAIGLPVYTGAGITGSLLDWVAQGLYGISRPSLASQIEKRTGPFNTYEFNTITFGSGKAQTTQNFTVVTDDIFKRIITWNFFKGDGTVVTVDWLKRRVLRFLTGVNGTDPGIQETYGVSITFPADHAVSIDIVNSLSYDSTILASFQEALALGVLQIPFQYTFTSASRGGVMTDSSGNVLYDSSGNIMYYS